MGSNYQVISYPQDNSPIRTMVALEDWPSEVNYMHPRDIVESFDLDAENASVTKWSVKENVVTGVTMIEFTIIGYNEDMIIGVVDGYREFLRGGTLAGKAWVTWLTGTEVELINSLRRYVMQTLDGPTTDPVTEASIRAGAQNENVG